MRWGKTLIQFVYGKDLLNPRQLTNIAATNTAATRLTALAMAWMLLMAGVTLVGPARESLSLDATLIQSTLVPYLISLSSFVTVALNWNTTIRCGGNNQNTSSKLSHTMTIGTWAGLFYGILLLACQSTLPRFTPLTNSTLAKSFSIGTFYIFTSAFAIFPVSLLWSELPEELLSIGAAVLKPNVVLKRQSYTFFGLCLTMGSLMGSFSVQLLVVGSGTHSLIFASACSFQLSKWCYNYATSPGSASSHKTVHVVAKDVDHQAQQSGPRVQDQAISLVAVYRDSPLARGILAYTAAYSMCVVIMYVERTTVLQAMSVDQRTHVLGTTGTISAVLTCGLQLFALWAGGKGGGSATSSTFVTLSALPVVFATSVASVVWVPTTGAVVLSVVAIRVVSFVVVRPQRELCWSALTKDKRTKAKMLADSAGRKFGDLIVPVYAAISGTRSSHVVCGLLVAGWLYVSWCISFYFQNALARKDVGGGGGGGGRESSKKNA